MSEPGKVKGIVQAGSMKLEAKVDGYDAIIDYPAEGYQPEGPVPGGYLAFALAGCKALICAQYFSGRGKDVTVEVDLNTDFGRADGERGDFQADFKVDLYFTGDVDEADLEKLKKIVDDECAVEHIILGQKNSVETNYKLAN